MGLLNIDFGEPTQFVGFGKNQRIAIIDGDVVAHLACKGRGKMKNGFHAIIEDHLKDAQFTKEEDEEYLEASYDNFEDLTVSLVKYCKADYFLMAVKGPTNYRDQIYADYKKHRIAAAPTRDSSKKYVPFVRIMAIEKGVAVEATNREADDMVRIWAEEARQCGDDFVVCSIDKDLKLIHGKHYLMHKHTMITVTQKYATRFYYEQLMKGDPTDSIPGIPGVGDVGAANRLEQYDTEQEFQAATIEAYQDYYGKDKWREYLLANGKLIYLQKHVDDFFNIRGWAQFA